MTSTPLETLQRVALARLRHAGMENAVQEARWMAELALREGGDDGAAVQACLETMLSRREAGIPFQYAVGSVEFYCVELLVGPGVLIPRPETEVLVEYALEHIAESPAGTAVLDLCTGSAAIPLAMAACAPQCHYTGVDISAEALAWAEKNRRRLKPPHLRLLQGDLFSPLPSGERRRYALITANPPYVSPAEYAELPAEIRDHEPRMALEADEDGMAVARRIVAQAPVFMRPDGCLLMEIGATQGEAIRQFADDNGYRKAQILKDWTGRNRFLKAYAPG